MINKDYLKSLNPCAGRYKSYLEHHKDFEGSLSEFLDLENIPHNVELIILPIDDPELSEYNRKTADKILSLGKKVIFVKMKKPEIPTPELELLPS